MMSETSRTRPAGSSPFGTSIFFAGMQSAGTDLFPNFADPAGYARNYFDPHGGQQIHHAAADPAADQSFHLMAIQQNRYFFPAADPGQALTGFIQKQKFRCTAQRRSQLISADRQRSDHDLTPNSSSQNSFSASFQSGICGRPARRSIRFSSRELAGRGAGRGNSSVRQGTTF